MTHHTRQMILDAIQGQEYLAIRLGDGDTAWSPARVHLDMAGALEGPGLVTYRFPPAEDLGGGYFRPGMVADFDPLAGDHDPRCDAVSPDGDVCRLLEGDHLAHYWGEPDEDGGGPVWPAKAADSQTSVDYTAGSIQMGQRLA